MQVGFIGLGTMGARMAANLQTAGHSLTVYDLRREAAEPHIAAGAVWVDSAREAAAASEVVFTSLPGPPEVEAIALGRWLATRAAPSVTPSIGAWTREAPLQRHRLKGMASES